MSETSSEKQNPDDEKQDPSDEATAVGEPAAKELPVAEIDDDFVDADHRELLAKALARRKQREFDKADPLLSADVAKPVLSEVTTPADDQAVDGGGLFAAPSGENYQPQKVDSPFAKDVKTTLGRNRLQLQGDRPHAHLLERLTFAAQSIRPATREFVRKRPRLAAAAAIAAVGAGLLSVTALASVVRVTAESSLMARQSHSKALSVITQRIIYSQLTLGNAHIAGALAPQILAARNAEGESEANDTTAGGNRQSGSFYPAISRQAALQQELSAEQEIADLQAQVQAAPGDWDLRVKFARVLYRCGRLREAAQQFALADKQKQLDVADRLLYADSLAGSDQIKEAESIYSEVLKADKTSNHARRGLAQLYFYSGDRDSVRRIAQDGMYYANSATDRNFFEGILNGGAVPFAYEPRHRPVCPTKPGEIGG